MYELWQTSVICNSPSFPPSGEPEGGFTITHVTDASGNVVNEYNFDAWGRRRNFTDWSYTVAAQTDILPDRGFTGHEYLPWFKLYNMNGRLYDPVVGRFLEPDPVIQDALSTQNLNRYSYCLNNPLKYNDPSGWVMNPGFNSSVWSMIESAWNNTQSNYDMIYTYDNGRMSGGSTLTYSGEGNTFWYSATVGVWYRDSQGNPTVKNGNSANFLTEFYSVTFPNINWNPNQGKGVFISGLKQDLTIQIRQLMLQGLRIEAGVCWKLNISVKQKLTIV